VAVILKLYSVCVCVQGEVLINDNSARLVERYLTFKDGLAYGIDQLLEPPGLGAFCDSVENRTTYVSRSNSDTVKSVCNRHI